MRLLTKSRFKLGIECPNKLYYTRKPEYANNKLENPFLERLAEGGFQVEEYARMHYPGGILLDDGYDYEHLAQKTQELLQQQNVIIYEAAFLIDGLFIRTDILVKKGDYVKLIEVKSKSFDPDDQYTFVGVRGGLKSTWKPYLYDISSQKYVMQQCHPTWKIDSYFMLADKSKVASIDGLNQNFKISNNESRTGIQVVHQDLGQLGDSVLGITNVSDIVSAINDGVYDVLPDKSFLESVNYLKQHYIDDTYASASPIFSACKTCEFKAKPTDEDRGLRSGFRECFTSQLGWSAADFEKPNTLDIWDFRKGNKCMQEGKVFKEDLSLDDLGHKEADDHISRTERQWIQIQKDLNNDYTPHILKDELRAEIATWRFPLNMIDFETSTVALPFHRGMRPYESIAFQYSHHIIHKDGRVEHQSEFINVEPGVFPNFDFIRSLRDNLSKNQGSIFMYSSHENTILNAIYIQLIDSDESDKLELMAFIETISHNKKDSAIKWKGDRDMIDLLDVVKRYYYNPHTGGSNSLKYVLPAILNTDSKIQDKYSQAIGHIGLSSRNFAKDHTWLHFENDEWINPYKVLPPLYQGWTEEELDNLVSKMDLVGDGSAAMTAYAQLQFSEVQAGERAEIKKALLRYCELDTLAMVMLYEHFIHIIA